MDYHLQYNCTSVAKLWRIEFILTHYNTVKKFLSYLFNSKICSLRQIYCIVIVAIIQFDSSTHWIRCYIAVPYTCIHFKLSIQSQDRCNLNSVHDNNNTIYWLRYSFISLIFNGRMDKNDFTSLIANCIRHAI